MTVLCQVFWSLAFFRFPRATFDTVTKMTSVFAVHIVHMRHARGNLQTWNQWLWFLYNQSHGSSICNWHKFAEHLTFTMKTILGLYMYIYVYYFVIYRRMQLEYKLYVYYSCQIILHDYTTLTLICLSIARTRVFWKKKKSLEMTMSLYHMSQFLS